MPRDPLDALYRALDDRPGDAVTVLALADWYEEQDDPKAAECLRWTAKAHHWPFRYWKNGPAQIQSANWHDGWYWWAVDDPGFGADWGHPPECRLAPALWKLLRHTFDYNPAVIKEYPTARSAYEALFEAWRKYRRRGRKGRR
jgi:uncharacterized protein (TIGR02996 family)